MSHVISIPSDAGQFFEEFFPEQFARHRHRYPSRDSPGWALFEVAGVGAWGVKIEGGALVVQRGKAEDTMIQISMSAEDFHDVFVERSRREVDATGDLSDDSRNAFNPLFVDERKIGAVLESIGTNLSTLAIRLDHRGTLRRLFITPGAFERTEPRATVTLRIGDFLAMLGGRRHPVKLFLLGRLKIRGDVSYALNVGKLLS